MKTFTPIKITALAASLVFLAACNQSTKEEATEAQPAAPEIAAQDNTALDLNDELAKVSYALGSSAGTAMLRNIESLDGTDIELDVNIIAQAFTDSIEGSSQLNEAQMQEVMKEFQTKVSAAMQEKQKLEQAEQAKVAEENIAKGSAYLEANKAKEGVLVTESGLQYKVITPGNGKSPAETDRVKVHYKGTLIDGTEFDSSYKRGQAATFGLNQVISGWTEGLQLMKEGAKWEFTIPSEMAYGAAARPTIPGNSVLVFEVELLEVVAPN